MEADDDVLAMLHDAAADFLAAPRGAGEKRGAIGVPRRVDHAIWREMAGLGWIGLGLPESAGGIGLGLSGATTLLELFGRNAFAEPYVAAAVIPSAILNACGDSAAALELAESLSTGDRLVTLAWQESFGEIDPVVGQTRLIDGQLVGTKRFVPAVEDILLVTAQEPAGEVIVAIAADADGVTVERHAAGNSHLAEVRFENAKILHGAPLLRAEAVRPALHLALDAGRIALSAQLAGIGAGCLEHTIHYVSGRIQFGRPIGSFQAIQHRCVDLYIASQLADVSWRHALRLHEAAPGAADNAASISASKARCSDAAMQIGKAAVQMHGAMGFTAESDTGLYLRAAMYYASWLGGSVAHRRRFLAMRLPAETPELFDA